MGGYHRTTLFTKVLFSILGFTGQGPGLTYPEFACSQSREQWTTGCDWTLKDCIAIFWIKHT